MIVEIDGFAVNVTIVRKTAQSCNRAVRQARSSTSYVRDAQAIQSNRHGALLPRDFDGYDELFADKPCRSVIRGPHFQPISLFTQHGYLRTCGERDQRVGREIRVLAKRGWIFDLEFFGFLCCSGGRSSLFGCNGSGLRRSCRRRWALRCFGLLGRSWASG